MSNYDDLELRYSCLSEPIQVPHSHPRPANILSIFPGTGFRNYSTSTLQNGTVHKNKKIRKFN